ncbi:hypothetical protein BRADI_3g27971v3 [Brachypodium distachyon]|uniref:Uncharacterized protein n=1 Tax=Brachypodium distachyon TaxID=15368 RepID=A0A2K2CZP0_BRADI|nr:hypothetical protein BRADI_3g27971v3 [Brachypodium distachyon]
MYTTTPHLSPTEDQGREALGLMNSSPHAFLATETTICGTINPPRQTSKCARVIVVDPYDWREGTKVSSVLHTLHIYNSISLHLLRT